MIPKTHKSSGFADLLVGSCITCPLPPYISQVYARFGKMLSLEGAGGMALQRLSQEGLAWVPTLGNCCALLAFILCVTINNYITGEGDPWTLDPSSTP